MFLASNNTSYWNISLLVLCAPFTHALKTNLQIRWEGNQFGVLPEVVEGAAQLSRVPRLVDGDVCGVICRIDRSWEADAGIDGLWMHRRRG